MPAGRLELPRQKVNYHLKELERHGLVELAEERRKGNVTERVYRAIAASYVISPSVLAAVSPDPSRSPDQLSAHWLLALGSRLAQEVGTLLTSVSRAGIDAQVRFASAAARTAFAEELARTVATLVSRYHDESAAGAAATGWSSDCTRSPHRPPPTRAGARSEPGPGSAREKSAQDESAQEKENRT